MPRGRLDCRLTAMRRQCAGKNSRVSLPAGLIVVYQASRVGSPACPWEVSGRYLAGCSVETPGDAAEVELLRGKRGGGGRLTAMRRQCAGKNSRSLPAGLIVVYQASRVGSPACPWEVSGRYLAGCSVETPLVSGRFCDSKTIIPEAQEHFLTPSARVDSGYVCHVDGLTAG